MVHNIGMNENKTRLSVVFFRTSSGREPVREWLKSLPVTERKAIGVEIKTVQLGWPLGMPVVRKLGQGLWEVRIHLADKIARVLFTTSDGRMILLHGFIKKSQKTPPEEMATSLKRLRQFMENEP